MFAASFARSLPIGFQCKIKDLFAVLPDNLAGIHTGLAEKFPPTTHHSGREVPPAAQLLGVWT